MTISTLLLVTILYSSITIILQYIVWKKKSTIKLKTTLIDLWLNSVFFIIFFNLSNHYFENIIQPYFAWNWSKFIDYMIHDSFSFPRYIFWFILVHILFVILFLYLKWKVYIFAWIKNFYNNYTVGTIILNISYIVLLFITYYTWLITYHFFII